MADTFDNSKATHGTGAAKVETGVIANVNVNNFTADWVAQYSGKQIPDLQIMTPYFHYNNGEGFSCVPEVGAICVVCFPSDQDPPFVMGFLSGPEMEGASVDKYLEERLKDPGVETAEDIPTSNTTQAGGSTVVKTNPSDASFRGGRPILNPGDMYWQGRDENFIVLRRGGVVQVGSTQICQRAYIPVFNYIRDFCENYELNTAAGTLSWGVWRVESNPEGNAQTDFTLISREYAQDEKASIKLSIGALEDATKPPGGGTTFIELTIAPQLIEPDSGEVKGAPKYVLRLDKVGNSYVMQAKDRTEEIKGNLKTTISGNREVTVGSNDKLTVTGTATTKITGTCTVDGSVCNESWSVSKVIGTPHLELGGVGALEGVPLGERLIAWLASHTHQVAAIPQPTGATIPTLVPTAPPISAALLSQIVKVK